MKNKPTLQVLRSTRYSQPDEPALIAHLVPDGDDSPFSTAPTSSVRRARGGGPKVDPRLGKLALPSSVVGHLGVLIGIRTDHFETVVVDTRGVDTEHAFVFVHWSPKRVRLDGLTHSFHRLGAVLGDLAVQRGLRVVSVAEEIDDEFALQALIAGARVATFTFTDYRSESESDRKSSHRLVALSVVAPKSVPRERFDTAVTRSDGVDVARYLAWCGPTHCNPVFFVKFARGQLKSLDVEVKEYEAAELSRMGAGGIVAVGRAGAVAPRLLRLRYPKGRQSGKRRERHLGLVGKGVCFDSGGLSLKRPKVMEDMKLDMAGAAAVLGAFITIARLRLPLMVSAYLPLVENLVSSTSVKPGDVVTTLSGKTVEVLNTDAEGRLILADAITLAQRDECSTIVDLATLTGACVVGLGELCAGLFSESDSLSSEILNAANEAAERVWRLPIINDYDGKLKSGIAHMKNVGDSWGGAITGALFLRRFVEIESWAHLDIAGPAMVRSVPGYPCPGPFGFGVATLVRLAERLSGQPR